MNMPPKPDTDSLLITGIPRSGTSLALHLLSLNKHNICLSEPRFLRDIKKDAPSSEEVGSLLSDKILEIKENILNGKSITMRLDGRGEVPDNYFQRKGHKIIELSKNTEVYLDKTPNMKIIIKSNLLFTSCLKTLQKYFFVVAIIRNPLYVLGSWKSLDLPISKGKVISGLKYSTSLQKIDDSDLTMKQIKLIDWFYSQYKNSPNIKLIKYEELVQSPHEVLAPWVDNINLPELTSMNTNKQYNLDGTIIDKVKNHSVLYKSLYS